jgi:hypothetical protein
MIARNISVVFFLSVGFFTRGQYLLITNAVDALIASLSLLVLISIVSYTLLCAKRNRLESDLLPPSWNAQFYLGGATTQGEFDSGVILLSLACGRLLGNIVPDVATSYEFMILASLGFGELLAIQLHRFFASES